MISSSSYLLGTFLLNPGCALFLPGQNVTAGTIVFITACAFLVLAATTDFVSGLHAHYKGQNKLTAAYGTYLVCMLMGGILFETASILYWPSFNTARIGTWTFRIGSFFYLGGSVSSFVMIYSAPIAETSRGDHEEDAATATDLGDEEAAGESLRAEEGGGPARPSCCISVSKHLSRRGHSIASVLFPVNHLAALAGTWAFVIGALLYIAGGVMSEFNLASVTAFALTWGVASCFFVVGSAIFFCKELMEKT